MWTSADTNAQAAMDGRYLIAPCPRCHVTNGRIVARRGETLHPGAFRCRFTITPGGESFDLCADEWPTLRAILKGD